MKRINTLITFHINHLDYINRLKPQSGGDFCIFSAAIDKTLIFLACVNYVHHIRKIDPEIPKVVFNDLSSIIVKLKEQNPCSDLGFLQNLEEYTSSMLNDNPELNGRCGIVRRL